MTILFTEENHKYFIKEKPDFKFVSISGLINLIKQEFDTKTEAKKYSEKGKDKILKDLIKKWGLSTEEAITKWGHLEMTPEDIEAIWLEKKDTSLVKGTTHHVFREDQSIRFEGGYPILYDGDIKQAYPLRDLKPGLYPELIIHNLEYGLIGTADRIKIYPDKTFEVFDYKTNQKIEFQGFKKYDKTLGFTVEQKLKRPVNHLSDSNGIKYTIQLSCYAYMLEQFGYTCKGLTLNHVILDDDGNLVNEIDYKLDYLKKEVVTLFNWFKKQ